MMSLTSYLTGSGSGRKDGHCFCPLASLYIFRDIINGVEHLHSEGIVHHDLKPGNVFLNVGDAASTELKGVCERCMKALSYRTIMK
jgi:serine/threonine protein kinase